MLRSKIWELSARCLGSRVLIVLRNHIDRPMMMLDPEGSGGSTVPVHRMRRAYTRAKLRCPTNVSESACRATSSPRRPLMVL